MKKIIVSLMSSIAVSSIVSAQNTVNDGVKFLYYERVTSAKQTLQRAVAANPKDPLAIYWLGQAYMVDGLLDSAKTLYQNALNNGVNEPLLWVGAGHVQIMQGGDVNTAKQHFEEAITASTPTKGRKIPNADVMNAIGRAMSTGGSNQGDPNYGIDKLKRAAQLDPNNPEIYVNLGMCYLKLGGDHGGEAFEAFRQATQVNPQYARAYYKIGRVYQTQRNKESMDEWYGKAIAADATFAPVYLQYFLYYSEKDVNTAKEYLDKYVQYADKDCNTDYFVGDYLFRAGKYQESLAKAKEMQAGACKNFHRANVLYAYDYDRLGDSVQARQYMQTFFQVADASEIEPDDVAFAGKEYAKFPGLEDTAIAYLMRAYEMDTVKENQIEYLTDAANVAAKKNDFAKQFEIMNKMAALKGGKLSETDYFKMASAVTDAAKADTTSAFDQAKYNTADSIVASYINAYPDKPQGYSFRVRLAKMMDKDSTKGLAVHPIEQYNQFLIKDTAASNKSKIFSNDTYLVLYYANYASGDKSENYKKAISIADEMMVLYPDAASEENRYASNIKKQLVTAITPKGGVKQGSNIKQN